MMRIFLILSVLSICFGISAPAQTDLAVGSDSHGGTVVATGQVVHPAGTTTAFGGRPVDLALSPDAGRLYVKDNRGLVVLDAVTMKVLQELAFPDKQGGSMHGIAVTSDGGRVYATTAQGRLCEAVVSAKGALVWARILDIPGPQGGGASVPCGIALNAGNDTAYICLSRNNTVAVVNLQSMAIVTQIQVGIAPFDIMLSQEGAEAWVSNWGGRPPAKGERTAPSSGTQVVIDERGVAASGTVSRIDLALMRETKHVDTGLHPSALALDPEAATLYVANANSDTVSAIHLDTFTLAATLSVRPDAGLPFGSAPGGLAIDAARRRLYVANGGNNAVAVVSLEQKDAPEVRGFIPTGWYPGALAIANGRIFVANVKGYGSRNKDPNKRGWHVYWHQGSVSTSALPQDSELGALTRSALGGALTAQAKRALSTAGHVHVRPLPVPRHTGEPSVFEHVVYIIKENRTYDQMFGDLPQGNGMPGLCVFPREVSPNHHALAEQFVLLDNYYCNGVLSADGHSWATEGNVTDHLEKSFGGFARSYTFGDDPLTFSSTGFIWDSVLARGLTFRNYGEFDHATLQPEKTPFKAVYDDFVSGTRSIAITHRIGVERMRTLACPAYPGWNLAIPDVLRADIFLRELADSEATGRWPNFMIVYLPQDHGSGTQPGAPTPRAHVADNDLALGRMVERISRSRFWPTTCIFVNEDDPQDGFDHVDGHRSICLVVSPYTKRGKVISEFYNQTSVLHTISRIFGCPPMNQMDAAAPLMSRCFTSKPDFSPYTALLNAIPLDELNPPKAALSGEALHWAEQSLAMDLSVVDNADEDTLNRIIWHSAMGVDAPYPEEYAGAHGKGLKKLGLVLSGSVTDED